MLSTTEGTTDTTALDTIDLILTSTRDLTPISTTDPTTSTSSPLSLLPPPRPTTGIIGTIDIIDTTATIVTTDTIGITDIDTTTEDEYRRLYQPLPSTIRPAAASAESGLTLNLGCRLDLMFASA